MFIFLDIDGVLIPDRLFDISMPKVDMTKFDSTCRMEFENVLRCYPKILIVISSSWREVFPFEVIPPLFSPDIAQRVVGATPFLEDLTVIQFFRHQEVLAYLRQNQAVNSPWVAVDDIPEHYPPGTAVVATDPSIGFDRIAAKALSEYLASF
ncbi:FCP1-like y domain-containing protein [Tumidithrix helvetica PCC 7403]|uniref:HAD domain-containing protein n=1 Tax=Tumidithrix helvetica TaxID=3457545 RepID=UPI003CA66417